MNLSNRIGGSVDFALDVLDRVFRDDFKSFLVKTFYHLNPEKEFLDNWHLDLFCEYLSAIASGDIKRLIVNVPPRSLKSICFNVAWPAWVIGNNPATKIISASYSQAISNKHSMDFQTILSSDWYSRSFPMQIISSMKNKVITAQHGFRMSTSIGGTLTGEGADFLIVDDPLTPMQALSNKFRQRALSWFMQSFMSRLNDKRRGAVILVMQRLHKDDLSGALLKAGGWESLILPAIATERTKINFGHIQVIRKKGGVLHSDRDGINDIEKAKKELGSYAFASQYQQSPEQIETGIINPKWLVRYSESPNFEKIYQSWDCAIKCGDKSDYTVCATFGTYGDKIYLIDILRKKLIYSKLKVLITELADKYQPTNILIEDKASGQQLLQELKHELPVVRCLPKWDKQTRLIISSYNIELGNFLIPYKANWLDDFELELTNFPYVAHDDQVDAITQFLLWYKNQKTTNYKIYHIQDS